MNLKASKICVPISISQSLNAKEDHLAAKPNVAKSMLIVATILASTSTWVTVSMASTACSPTPLKDKSTSQNLPKKFVESSTMKTTVLRVTSAVFHTTSELSHASITL